MSMHTAAFLYCNHSSCSASFSPCCLLLTYCDSFLNCLSTYSPPTHTTATVTFLTAKIYHSLVKDLQCFTVPKKDLWGRSPMICVFFLTHFLIPFGTMSEQTVHSPLNTAPSPNTIPIQVITFALTAPFPFPHIPSMPYLESQLKCYCLNKPLPDCMPCHVTSLVFEFFLWHLPLFTLFSRSPTHFLPKSYLLNFSQGAGEMAQQIKNLILF